VSGPTKLEECIEATRAAFRNWTNFKDPCKAGHEQSVDQPGSVWGHEMRGFPEELHLFGNREGFGGHQFIAMLLKQRQQFYLVH